MYPTFKCWRSWLTRKLFWPLYELIGLRVQDVRVSYEKAGLTVSGEPIPWNAEAVVVDAAVWFPPNRAKRKSDFQLYVPGRAPLIPVTMYPAEADGVFHIVFRLPPPRGATAGTLCCRDTALARVPLPFVGSDAFIQSLQLRSPTLTANLGNYNIACQAHVGSQCRRIVTSGLLTSPTSLLPLSEFDLVVECRDAATGSVQTATARLTGAQLLGRQALVSVLPVKGPTPSGTCTLRWLVRDRVLASAEVRCLSQAAFKHSVYLIEGRFLHQNADGTSSVIDHLPFRDETGHVCPCFLVASREPGVAALCPLEVRAQFKDPGRPPIIWQEEVLVTDGPSVCVPGVLSVEDFQKVRAFELFSEGRPVGVLPVGSTPVATFSAEGGFRFFEEYDWGPITEKELVSRLQKLMESSYEENATARN